MLWFTLPGKVASPEDPRVVSGGGFGIGSADVQDQCVARMLVVSLVIGCVPFALVEPPSLEADTRYQSRKAVAGQFPHVHA